MLRYFRIFARTVVYKHPLIFSAILVLGSTGGMIWATVVYDFFPATPAYEIIGGVLEPNEILLILAVFVASMVVALFICTRALERRPGTGHDQIERRF